MALLEAEDADDGLAREALDRAAMALDDVGADAEQRSSTQCSDSGSSRSASAVAPVTSATTMLTCRRRRSRVFGGAAAGAAGAGHRGRRKIELGILGEHQPLQPPQLLAGLEPELLGEEAARVAVDGERVGLAPGAVEGEHEVGARALAERLGRHQLLQLGDQLGVPAERRAPPRCDARARPAAARRGGRPRCAPGPRTQPLQRLAAPQRQRARQRRRRRPAARRRRRRAGRARAPARSRGSAWRWSPRRAAAAARTRSPAPPSRRSPAGTRPRARASAVPATRPHRDAAAARPAASAACWRPARGAGHPRDLERTEDPKLHHVSSLRADRTAFTAS